MSIQPIRVRGRLLDRAEDRARTLGAIHLALDTSEDALGLVRMYQDRGYRWVGPIDYRPDVNYRSIILALTL